jgi:hypothetical protein
VTAQPVVNVNIASAIPAEIKPDFHHLQHNAKFTPTEGKKSRSHPITILAPVL